MASILKLEPTLHRKGGSHQHERFTYDFVINEKSLAASLQIQQFDRVGCLDVINQKWNGSRAKALLLTAPADIPPNRCMLYVCAECDDLGCGAFTAEISKTADQYIWSTFRYENGYDDSMINEYPRVGPFEFEAAQYESVFAGFE